MWGEEDQAGRRTESPRDKGPALRGTEAQKPAGLCRACPRPWACFPPPPQLEPPPWLIGPVWPPQPWSPEPPCRDPSVRWLRASPRPERFAGLALRGGLRLLLASALCPPTPGAVVGGTYHGPYGPRGSSLPTAAPGPGRALEALQRCGVSCSPPRTGLLLPPALGPRGLGPRSLGPRVGPFTRPSLIPATESHLPRLSALILS